MTGKTHIVGGFLVGVLATQALDINIGYAVVSAVGSLLPDIDEPKSTIGRKIPGTFLIKFLFSHRGFFHSLLATGLFYLILLMVTGQALALLFTAGYISHLLLDAITPSGVPFLYPKKQRYSLNLIRTGGIIEYAFMFAMIILLLAVGGVNSI